MTLSRLAIATAAAALLGLGAAGCGSQAGTAAGQPTPQKLHLASSATAAPVATPGNPAQTVPSPAPPVVPRWAQVKLTGPLPTGGPATGAVRTLPGGQAPEATVSALASALHLPGPPQRTSGGWKVTGPGTLQVNDGPGLRWTYVGVPILRCNGGALRGPGSAPGAQSGASSTGQNPRAAAPAVPKMLCPMKPGQPEPFEPVPTPSGGTTTGGTSAPPGATAESVAMPVLQAAGVAGSPLRITTIGSFTFVSADPTVDRLATSGFATTIGVGAGGSIAQASGWLSRPALGSSYPLISAQQAVNRLKASTHPVPGGHPPEVMCPLNPDVLCGTPGPIEVIQVTGAAYGLALSYNRGEPVLVPAWLFSVAGTGLKVPEVAINPRYLAG